MNTSVKNFFYKMPANIARAFWGWGLFMQGLAIALTYVIVSGLDWKYYQYFHASRVGLFLFPAAFVGFLVPPFLPVLVYLFARLFKKGKLAVAAFALGQSAMAGYLVSIFYKAFTGRAHPVFPVSLMTDVTRQFQFGFLRGGVFWGWPSSHSAVAFAMAFALVALFPKNKKVKFWAIIYAIYISIGVSMTIHWLSDAVAGALMGAAVGLSIGHAFFLQLQKNNSQNL